MSSKNNWLRFFDIRIFSFAGFFKGKQAEITYPEGFTPKEQIDPDGGIVIFFPPDHRYVEVSGDQGTGKTSFLNLFKEACGHLGIPQFINRTDGTKRYEGTVQGMDGESYRFKATKTEFNLWQQVKDEEGNVLRERTEKSPKDTMKRLVGPAGISPLEVAAMKPEKQVEWIRSVVKLSKEQQELEQQLKKEIEQTYEARKKANSKTNELDTILKSNDYFINYEKWKEYFETTSFDTLEADIKEVRQLYQEYTQKQAEIFRLNERKAAIDKSIEDYEHQIRELQLKLEGCKKEWLAVDKQVDELSLFLGQNADVLQNHAEADKKVREASEFGAKKVAFENIERQLKDYNHYSDEAVRLDHRLSELRQKKQEFNQLIAPPVEGLEVFLPDADDKRHGIFYKGMPLDLLCESDNWEWFPQLCVACGIRVMYIEHITELGTGAVTKFNEFIEAGGFVFATKMKRGENMLRISFNTKIPV